MLATYRPLFAIPGASRFVAASALSRVGGAMFGVAIIVMISTRRDSYGLAGAVSAGGIVVLAPAGSSDPRAQADSVETARRLAERWGGPVTLGYAAGPVPTVADGVRSAREAAGGRSVAVASYLLAPGFFQRRVEAAGGDVVTGPVAPDPRVVDLVVARYRSALATGGTAH